jgi:acetyl-CoA carboxylase biotin carboxyl carrier protein
MAAKSKKTTTSKTPAPPSAGVNLEHLESVLKLLAKHGVGEFEWASGQDRLHVKAQAAILPSGGGASAVHVPVHASAPLATSPVAHAPVAPSAAAAQVSKPTTAHSSAKEIESPFVGTFYRSPSPSADPYVREGQVVKKGDALCIIEAMKLMNEIEAEVDGRIVKVLVENGQPVEFGEPLFLVEPV